MARLGELSMGEKEKETREEVSQPVPDSERRRLVKASLAAAPVLLTLAARPILASDRKKPTKSEADSATHSSHAVAG